MRRLVPARATAAQMEVVSSAAAADLVDGGEVLVTRRDGTPKVVRTRDGRIAKRISPEPCGGAFDRTPRSIRFLRHAERLVALGIAAPTECRACAVDGERDHLLVYCPVPGEALRDAAADAARRRSLAGDFAEALARLHDAGVVFRAGHLGNYILGADGSFGLIDVHALSLVGGSVSVVRRARSFRILLKDARDRAIVASDGGVRGFLARYRDATRLDGLRSALVAALVRTMHPTARRAWHVSDG